MKIGSRRISRSCKCRHFENTQLLAGNDHVIDMFTSEDMENISLCISVCHCHFLS